MCACVTKIMLKHAQGSVVVFFRHVLGFPTEELLRGPIIMELQEQLSQQMPYLHLIHWCVRVCVFVRVLFSCVTYMFVLCIIVLFPSEMMFDMNSWLLSLQSLAVAARLCGGDGGRL